jgi:hypothetical protein
MMKSAPCLVDGANVLLYTSIDHRHHPTGGTKHSKGSTPLEPAAGLAICRYPGEDGIYLFYCDSNWACVTDTWHASVEAAKTQAEFEYAGTMETWSAAAQLFVQADAVNGAA